MPPKVHDLTRLLRAWGQGDAAAGEALAPVVYQELRRLADRRLRGERPGHTLRPTDLVAEAFVRLLEGATVDWNDRVHFFAVAAATMRHILVDHARRRRAGKRDGGLQVTIDEAAVADGGGADLVAIHEALTALAAVDERAARAVELRYFGGLANDEIAAALGVALRTVARDLRAGQAWIGQHLQDAR